MTQEVKVIVRGLHMQNTGEEEPIEVISVGQMYEKDGFVCVSYDEVVGEENGQVQVEKNLLKINDTQVEVIKKGSVGSHMIFVPEQTTFTYYSTPVGELEVGIHTDSVEKTEYDKGFELKLQYALEMNQTLISSCCVDIAVEK